MKSRVRIVFAIILLALVGCAEPDYGTTPDTTIVSLGTPPDNEIWFTTNDDRGDIAINESAFDAEITDIEYVEFGTSIIHFDKALTVIGEEAFYNCRNLNNISLPNSVEAIGKRAFSECTNLECMTIGNSIKSCGTMAFDNCGALYSLHIPAVGTWCNIEFADPMANPLYHCGGFIVNGNKVRDVVIPEWVERIGTYAFYNYSTMSSVEIPASIVTIGKSAFEGCEGLSKVDIRDIAMWCKITFESETANPLSIAGTLYINGQKATNLSLDGVSTINDRAFIRCSSLQTLVAEDIQRIGLEAFRGCDALTKITLGEGVKDIHERAFMGCMALKSVTIPDSVTSIGNYAFGYCSSLTSVTIGNNVTSIGDAAFYDCSNLEAFYGKFVSTDNCCLIVDGVLHSFAIGCGATEYTIPDSVIEIGNSSFYNCGSLTNVNIGDSVTSIGDSVFRNCSSLTSATIGNSVTSIGDSAFCNCSGMTSITIPDSVTSIGERAFYDCSSLKSVYCKPVTPPTGGYNMFGYNADGRTFYVPSSAIEDYKNATYWSEYAESIKPFE